MKKKEKITCKHCKKDILNNKHCGVNIEEIRCHKCEIVENSNELQCNTCKSVYTKPRIYCNGLDVERVYADINEYENLNQIISEEKKHYVLMGQIELSDRYSKDAKYFPSFTSSLIIKRNFKQISESDIVITYLCDLKREEDTMAELGYAYSLGKTIFVKLTAVDLPYRYKYWFAIEMSLNSIKSNTENMLRINSIFKYIPHIGNTFKSLREYLDTMNKYIQKQREYLFDEPREILT